MCFTLGIEYVVFLGICFKAKYVKYSFLCRQVVESMNTIFLSLLWHLVRGIDRVMCVYLFIYIYICFSFN